MTAEILDKPVRQKPAFDLDAYIASGAFGISVEAGQSIHLVVDFAREAAHTFLERPLAANQSVEEIGKNTVRLTADVPDTLELRRWLLGFAELAVVQQPAALREEMCKKIARMQQAYAG